MSRAQGQKRRLLAFILFSLGCTILIMQRWGVNHPAEQSQATSVSSAATVITAGTSIPAPEIVSQDVAIIRGLEGIQMPGPGGYLVGPPDEVRGRLMTLADAYMFTSNGLTHIAGYDLDELVWLFVVRGTWVVPTAPAIFEYHQGFVIVHGVTTTSLIVGVQPTSRELDTSALPLVSIPLPGTVVALPTLPIYTPVPPPDFTREPVVETVVPRPTVTPSPTPDSILLPTATPNPFVPPLPPPGDLPQYPAPGELPVYPAPTG
ncbi:MAG TPA: hypothetical protein PKA05_13385 [Roseiflexaceae bacterium]|nr:hypothetical protein [Roseiflexaceae bacterium]